jgi:hypothetical protein
VDHDALIRRLAGDGQSGGGFSLPDAFRAVAESLMADKMSSVPDLARKVAATPLGLREKRVLAGWGSWEEFTRDILRVMEHQKLVISIVDGELWTLDKDFKPGEAYPVIQIPERDLTIEFTALSPDDKSMKARRAKHALALAQVRAEVAADGLLLSHIDDLFGRLMRDLSRGRTSVHRGRPRIGTPDPPEDQPDRMSMCPKCGEDFPLTRENFNVFPSRGLWYWRKECLRDMPAKAGSPVLRKRQVEAAVLALTADGIPPSGQDVMQYLGLNDDRQLRTYWDQLAAEGKVLPRQRRV